jgi:outer membrane protein OmpA-like peptidoglycan-associated protein
MILLLACLARAQEPEPCHFDKAVSATELKDAMVTCFLPVGSEISVRVEEVTPVETHPGIGFHGNDSALTDNGRQTLDSVAAILTIRKKLSIKIVGYADGTETGDLLDLSLRRAQSAAKYLETKGISSDRISIEAAGADKLIDVNDTAEGHARNRRVEFVLSAS